MIDFNFPLLNLNFLKAKDWLDQNYQTLKLVIIACLHNELIQRLVFKEFKALQLIIFKLIINLNKVKHTQIGIEQTFFIDLEVAIVNNVIINSFEFYITL
jgi:hypothetical protein